MPKTLRLIFDEEKKHSGKYVVDGTQEDTYPQYYYLKKEWFDKRVLPRTVEMVITPLG